MARKYTGVQIASFILSIFIPPLSVWLFEGAGRDFWINILLCLCGGFPGSIHAFYLMYVWVKRKHETFNGRPVPDKATFVFSKEFLERSTWKGNGQDGKLGYFDDDIRGGKDGYVGGEIDPELAKTKPQRQAEEEEKKRKEEEAELRRQAEENVAQPHQEEVYTAPTGPPPIHSYSAGETKIGTIEYNPYPTNNRTTKS